MPRPGETRTSMLLFVLAAIAASLSFPPSPLRQDPLDEYRLAVGYAERGFHDRAVEECRRFLREHPDHEKAPYVRYRLGQSLYELKRWQEAADALEGVIGRRPSFEF